MSVLLYSLVDVPPPPSWIIVPDTSTLASVDRDSVIQLANQLNLKLPEYSDKRGSAGNKDYADRVLVDDDQTYISGYTHPLFYLDRETSWAKEFISPTAKDFRFSFTDPRKQRIGPHVDLTRHYTMMYLLEPGGDDHCTIFWQENSVTELERSPGYHVDNYTKLTEILKVQIPTNQWVILNARVLHSIHNISLGRKSFQVSLDVFSDNFPLVDPIYY